MTFDEAWTKLRQPDRPVWLRHLRDDPDLVNHLIEWVDTPTWEASQSYLTERATDLLSDPADAAIEHLIDSNPAREELTLHLAILQAARSKGIDATYEALGREPNQGAVSDLP